MVRAVLASLEEHSCDVRLVNVLNSDLDDKYNIVSRSFLLYNIFIKTVEEREGTMIVEKVITKHFNIPRNGLTLSASMMDEIEKLLCDWADKNKASLVSGDESVGGNVIEAVAKDINAFVDDNGRLRCQIDDSDLEGAVVVKRMCRNDFYMKKEDAEVFFLKFPAWQIAAFSLVYNRNYIYSFYEIGLMTVSQILDLANAAESGQKVFFDYDGDDYE